MTRGSVGLALEDRLFIPLRDGCGLHRSGIQDCHRLPCGLCRNGDAARFDRIAFLATLPGHKTVLLDAVPTAENLARIAFGLLEPAYQDTFGNQLRLQRVRLYETPNCWADAARS